MTLYKRNMSAAGKTKVLNCTLKSEDAPAPHVHLLGEWGLRAEKHVAQSGGGQVAGGAAPITAADMSPDIWRRRLTAEWRRVLTDAAALYHNPCATFGPPVRGLCKKAPQQCFVLIYYHKSTKKKKKSNPLFKPPGWTRAEPPACPQTLSCPLSGLREAASCSLLL